MDYTSKVYDFGQRVGRNIREGCTELKDSLVKNPYGLLYPIIGNLSDSLQQRIAKITDNNYNPINATETTFATNLIFYFAGGVYFTSKILGNDSVAPEMQTLHDLGTMIGIVGPMIYSMGESLYRSRKTDCDTKTGCASLPGKIVSLPLETIIGCSHAIKGVYNGIRGE
jgi:hypothetical protein